MLHFDSPRPARRPKPKPNCPVRVVFRTAQDQQQQRCTDLRAVFTAVSHRRWTVSEEAYARLVRDTLRRHSQTATQRSNTPQRYPPPFPPPPLTAQHHWSPPAHVRFLSDDDTLHCYRTSVSAVAVRTRQLHCHQLKLARSRLRAHPQRKRPPSTQRCQ